MPVGAITNRPRNPRKDLRTAKSRPYNTLLGDVIILQTQSMGNLRRTHYCGELRVSDAGKTAVVCGWVARQRDMGGLIFVDLRDRTGIIQLAFDNETAREVFAAAGEVRSEYVLLASGVVRERSAKNTDIPTGEVELAVSELRPLGKAETPPFEIAPDCATREEIRLQYRYLDLRRPDLQQNIITRHKIVKTARDYYDSQGFIEIETPIMIKSTPEGARDYLVPSRIHKGRFYALPQSPQIYKQLLMVAGYDRYIQFARCFRDEDLRADRQPEFTQIDLEMSFVDIDNVLEVNEGFVRYLFKRVMDIDIPLPLPRITYEEAIRRFGSDKPDLRFDMELCDLTDTVKNCGFGVFANAAANSGRICGIAAKNAAGKLSRKEIDKLTEFVRGIGAKGLAWVRLTPEGATSSFAKFMTADEMAALCEKMGAQTGDVILIVADSAKTTLSTLGALRLEVAKKLGIIRDEFNFLWVTEFPFFEKDEETGEFVAMHHPFTSPMDEDIPLLDCDKQRVRAKAYDLVLNGMELSSGSIRITDPDLQKRMFAALGLSEQESAEKFGFLVDAFKYGAPPHGGMGIGLDRLVLQMLGGDSLRDVIAFPKIKDASEVMTQCPAEVDSKQLSELGIKID